MFRLNRFYASLSMLVIAAFCTHGLRRSRHAGSHAAAS